MLLVIHCIGQLPNKNSTSVLTCQVCICTLHLTTEVFLVTMKDMDAQHLAEAVFSARRKLKISQSELARLSGISRNYVSLIERGEASNVSMNILEQLATVLGMKTAALTGESEQQQTLIPAALREFALEAGLSFDIVDKLAHIPRRGAEPQSAQAWAELYEAIRPYLDN